MAYKNSLFLTEVLTDDNGTNHQRGSMQNNHSRVAPIHNYPDPINQVHFSTNNMIGSPKGVNSSRMFQGVQQKGMQIGFPPGHLPPQPQQQQQPSNNSIHQINNNNISSQPHLNAPWSNGSAGSSG